MKKTGAFCAPGADCSAREGTKIRNSAPSAKKPTTFARKHSAFRENRPTFFSFCARCVPTPTTLCRKPTSGRGKRTRTTHKNTFSPPKTPFNDRKMLYIRQRTTTEQQENNALRLTFVNHPPKSAPTHRAAQK
jgi:hypothetical protein